MKSIWSMLQEKEAKRNQIQRELDALRLVYDLLKEEADPILQEDLEEEL